MAKRKPFALRIDGEMLAALQRYADDELRSLNAQLEYLLRQSLRDAGRWPPADTEGDGAQEGLDAGAAVAPASREGGPKGS